MKATWRIAANDFDGDAFDQNGRQKEKAPRHRAGRRSVGLSRTEEIMNDLALIGNTPTMTSIEMVEFINGQRKEGEAELRHDNFMAKVPKVLGEEAALTLKGSYIGRDNTVRPCYYFPKREACLMAMSYSYELQAKVFDRMTALEEQQKPITLPNFSNPADAARAWAEQYEARLIAEKTKAEIGSRRDATAMNTASQAVKKASALEIQLDRSMQYATVKRMEMLYHGQRFNWRLLKATATEMQVPPIDVFDQNYGKVNAYHADVWMEAYALPIAGEVA
jgi:hypothetical protein